MSDITQNVTGIGSFSSAGSGSGSGIGSLIGTLSMTTIIVGLLAGLVGSGYFMYGKKSCNFRMVFSGIALCIVPYFIGNTILLVIACLALAIAPFVLAG